MCRASGACVLSTWHVKSTRCISTIQIIVVWCVFRYNISAESPAKSTLSQGHGLSTGGVSIYIYVFCLFLSLSVSLHASIHPSISIDESPDWRLPFQLPCQGHPRKALHPKFFRKKRSVRLTILWF